MEIAQTPLCELRQIDVRYGPLWANRGVSLAVAPGEIVALVGENGAGKSTLLHALYGTVAMAGGEVRYHGEEVAPSPERAIAAGIGLLHQHFMLVPTLTVAENVVLGREPRRGLLRAYDGRRAEEETAVLGDRYGLLVDPGRRVSELTVGEAQRVEILKVLYRGARLLLLDEPTAVLTPGEVERLLLVLRRLMLKEDGVGRRGMLLVTHKLDEVMAIADRVVVMRRGEVVTEAAREACTAQDIARAMVGRELRPVSRGRALPGASGGAGSSGLSREPGPMAVLEVEALAVDRDDARRVSDVSLQVRGGEILGVAGVEGNGQTELFAAIAGLLPVAAGSVRLCGADLSTASVAARRRAGMALVSEDRHRHGLVLDFSLAENFLLGHDADHAAGPGGVLVDRARLDATARTLLREHEVYPGDPDVLARSLSGGNQQKVVLARELHAAPRLLLLSQPTRGVDIGAIEAIHGRLLKARDRGCAILLFSAELDELRALCDRIAVMYRGRIVAQLENPAEAPVSRDRLGELMTGAGAVSSNPPEERRL